jgi:hypothetical protein
MGATMRSVLVLAFAATALLAPTGQADARAKRATRPTRGHGEKVAVQPFDGPNAEPLRGLVARIVRGRGFRPTTKLPYYEGTGQYPGLARDHHLTAFVTAELEDRGNWQRITFLVWNGLTGSILGRWTTSAPTTHLARAIGKGFWRSLGPAMLKAEAPPLPPRLEQAPPMRIDASNGTNGDRIASGY